MADNYKVEWDVEGKRFFQTGIDRCVLYVYSKTAKTPGGPTGYINGVAWDGVTGFTESPSGAEAQKIYADNIQYLTMMSAEELGGTLTAYQSPEEFDACDGTKSLADGVNLYMQERQTFGLCYRTRIGNDIDGDAHGYKLHLIYGCKASPSERAFATVNDSPEAAELSWTITTTPVTVPGFRATALVTIDSTKVNSTKLASFEQILYGTPEIPDPEGGDPTPAVEARLPLPAEVQSHFATT